MLVTDVPLAVCDVASRQRYGGGFDFFWLRARFEPYLEPYVKFWQPYYDESAAKSRERNLKREAQRALEEAASEDFLYEESPYAKSPGFVAEQETAQNKEPRKSQRRRRREDDELMAQADAVFKELSSSTRNKDPQDLSLDNKSTAENDIPQAQDENAEDVERQNRLARARAWRASMNLEP